MFFQLVWINCFHIAKRTLDWFFLMNFRLTSMKVPKRWPLVFSMQHWLVIVVICTSSYQKHGSLESPFTLLWTYWNLGRKAANGYWVCLWHCWSLPKQEYYFSYPPWRHSSIHYKANEKNKFRRKILYNLLHQELWV